MTKTIKYKTKDILDILKDLNTLVVSIDKLGSAKDDMAEEEYIKASREFLLDWKVFHVLANARYQLSSVIEENSDLEIDYHSRLQSLEHWSFSKRKPSAQWVAKVEQRHER